MSDDLVAIARYGSVIEADMDRADLEMEGIESFLPEENAASINYPNTILLGGVRLMVRESDVMKAVEVLGIPEPPRRM